MFFQIPVKNIRLSDYPPAQLRWFGGRARYFGVSAKNCIFPLLQQGQIVMSVPVSFRIISSSESVSFVGGADNPIKLRMVFKFALRLRLAKKP